MMYIQSRHLKSYIINFMHTSDLSIFTKSIKAFDSAKSDILGIFMFCDYSSFLYHQQRAKRELETLKRLNNIVNGDDGYAIIKSILRHYNFKHIDTYKAGEHW